MDHEGVILKRFRALASINTAQSAIYSIVFGGLLWLCCGVSLQAHSLAVAQSAPQSLVLDQAQGWLQVETAAQPQLERVLIQLPYHWDKQHNSRSGSADWELAFDLPGEPSEPHALFVSRMGNRYELWLNGVLISRGGNFAQNAQAMDRHQDFGKSRAISPFHRVCCKK
ncbi:MAG: hypothetical protein HC858_05515 [Brachymonas sp.]|nr:hypothetical protein [Brachymonas sp.]